MARPTEPLITRNAAVATALKLIDESGIEGFGVERLAQELGVRAPSLYHHFSGKAEILAQVARLVTFEVVVPTEPASDRWQDWLVEISTRFRRAVLRHPNAAPLLVQYFPRRFTLSTYERGTRLLLDSGVPVELHALIFEGLDRLTFGWALFSALSRSQGVTELFPGIDPDRDPGLILASEKNPWSDEELFREAIRSFLRGATAASPSASNGGKRKG